MSTTVSEDDLRDPYEVGLSVPAISWAEHRVGDGFKDAIILPTPSGRWAGKGYSIAPKYKTVVDPVSKARTTEVDRWPDGNAKTQTVLFLRSDMHEAEFMSDNAVEKFKTAAASDDDELTSFIRKVKQFGLRRFYISGLSLDPEWRNALKPYGGTPVIGAYVSASLVKLDPNEYGGKTKYYKVEYRLPDARSMDLVNEYLSSGPLQETGKQEVGGEGVDHANASKSSAPASTSAAHSGDEPPF